MSIHLHILKMQTGSSRDAKSWGRLLEATLAGFSDSWCLLHAPAKSKFSEKKWWGLDDTCQYLIGYPHKHICSESLSCRKMSHSRSGHNTYFPKLYFFPLSWRKKESETIGDFTSQVNALTSGTKIYICSKKKSPMPPAYKTSSSFPQEIQ